MTSRSLVAASILITGLLCAGCGNKQTGFRVPADAKFVSYGMFPMPPFRPETEGTVYITQDQSGNLVAMIPIGAEQVDWVDFNEAPPETAIKFNHEDRYKVYFQPAHQLAPEGEVPPPPVDVSPAPGQEVPPAPSAPTTEVPPAPPVGDVPPPPPPPVGPDGLEVPPAPPPPAGPDGLEVPPPPPPPSESPSVPPAPAPPPPPPSQVPPAPPATNVPPPAPPSDFPPPPPPAPAPAR